MTAGATISSLDGTNGLPKSAKSSIISSTLNSPHFLLAARRPFAVTLLPRINPTLLSVPYIAPLLLPYSAFSFPSTSATAVFRPPRVNFGIAPTPQIVYKNPHKPGVTTTPNILHSPENGPIRDYRLSVRIRNNRLLTHIERTGATSIKAFCDSNKLPYQTLCQLLRMERPVFNIQTGWSKQALRISRVLGQPPHELFRGRQLLANFTTTKLERTADEDELTSINETSILSLHAPQSNPETLSINKDLVAKLLTCLSQRQRIVVSATLGLDGPPITLDQIGELIPNQYTHQPLGRERVNQIFHKAIALMQKRAVKLGLIKKTLSPQDHADWLIATQQRKADKNPAEIIRPKQPPEAEKSQAEKSQPRQQPLSHSWDGTPFHWFCVPCQHHNPGHLNLLPRFVFCEACGAKHNNTAYRETTQTMP